MFCHFMKRCLKLFINLPPINHVKRLEGQKGPLLIIALRPFRGLIQPWLQNFNINVLICYTKVTKLVILLY